MIEPVRQFTKDSLTNKHFDKVLEVGSRDVNGSVKDLIVDKCKEYIGLDLIDGKNVDIVDDAENISSRWPNETFDFVVCVETLEHVKNPIKIVQNMRNVLKHGGYMLITTPCIGHPQHDWPSDYYRYFETTYRDVFFVDFEELDIRTLIWNCDPITSPNVAYPHAILGFGKKP